MFSVQPRWPAIKKPKSPCLRNLLTLCWIEFEWTTAFPMKHWGPWQRHFPQCANRCTIGASSNPTVCSCKNRKWPHTNPALGQTIAVSPASAARGLVSLAGLGRWAPGSQLERWENPYLITAEYIAGSPSRFPCNAPPVTPAIFPRTLPPSSMRVPAITPTCTFGVRNKSCS